MGILIMVQCAHIRTTTTTVNATKRAPASAFKLAAWSVDGCISRRRQRVLLSSVLKLFSASRIDFVDVHICSA